MLRVGNPLPIQTMQVRDAAGVLANAGSMTLTVYLPDGSTAAPGFTNPSAGVYVPGAYITTMEGRYEYAWVGTGVNADSFSEGFTVRPLVASGWISLADAKQHLNITSTSQDDELELYIEATTGAVEGIIGPVGRRTVTETVYPSSGVLLLSTAPVLSLTSVTPYLGVALTVGSLIVSGTSGVVYPGTYGGFYATRYDVVYVAGRASVPAEVHLAARIILAHLWETQRGAADSAFASPDEIGLPVGFGFAIPNRAKELLARYRLTPAVA